MKGIHGVHSFNTYTYLFTEKRLKNENTESTMKRCFPNPKYLDRENT